jgi:hypothetical protein
MSNFCAMEFAVTSLFDCNKSNIEVSLESLDVSVLSIFKNTDKFNLKAANTTGARLPGQEFPILFASRHYRAAGCKTIGPVIKFYNFIYISFLFLPIENAIAL